MAAVCPVCLTEISKHEKGAISITRLDGSIVSLNQWMLLIREEESLEKQAKQSN